MTNRDVAIKACLELGFTRQQAEDALKISLADMPSAPIDTEIVEDEQVLTDRFKTLIARGYLNTDNCRNKTHELLRKQAARN